MAGSERRDLFLDIHERVKERGATQVASDLERLAKGLDVTQDKFEANAEAAEAFNVEIEKSKARIHDLSLQFAATGDKALVLDINRETSNLRRLERAMKSVTSLAGTGGEMAAAGAKAGGQFFDGFADALGPAKAVLIGTLVTVVAAAAPAIGAMIAGAVAGTTVGGGMAGGIIAATNDTRVRAAFKDFGSEFTAEAFGGEAFVMPVVESINLLKSEFRDLGLGETFAKAASSVPVLAQGLADLVSNTMPGFNRLMDQAPEFTDAFAEGLGEVGEGLSDFFASLSESEGTIEGLRFGMSLLSKIIVGTGNALQWLGDRFSDMREFGAVFNGAMEDVLGWVPIQGDIHRQLNDMAEDSAGRATHLGQRIGAVATEMEKQRDEVDGAAEAWKHINDEWERSIDLQANLMQGQIGFEEALDELNESLQENGKNFDINTEAGRENMRALMDVAESARDIRQGMIAAGSGTDAANEAFRQNIQKLYEMGEQAGLARWEIDQLIGKLLSIPVTYGEFVLSTEPRSEGRKDGRAAGGPAYAGEAYIVGDGGRPEVLQMGSTSGYVHRSIGAYANAMGGGGGQTLRLEAGGTPTNELEALFTQWMIRVLSNAIRTQGNGNVQSFLGGQRPF